MYITSLSTFEQVEAWYTNTKPIKSKLHTLEQDVRPIGKRGRKYERIIKISDNCYALSNGGNHDPVFCWGRNEDLKTWPLTPNGIKNSAPIVWQRHKDGSETLTIRNAWGDWMAPERYSFLKRALPHGLDFIVGSNGDHFVRTRGREYYAPRTRTVPTHVYERLKEEAANIKVGPHPSKRLAMATPKQDGLALTFKRDGTRWAYVGEPHVQTVTRKHVDRDSKKQHRAQIAKLWEWCMAMYPMMRAQMTWEIRATMHKEIAEWCKENKSKEQPRHGNYNNLFLSPGGAMHNLTRSILNDEDHPLRYHLGVAAMLAISSALHPSSWGTNRPSEEEQTAAARVAYNKWVNDMFGFNKATKVIKE